MKLTTYEDVNNYLEHNRVVIGLFGVYFIKRTQEDIIYMGLTYEIAEKIVYNLTPEQYVSGPDPDHMFPYFNVWVFGVSSPINLEEIYIKVSDRRENKKPVCISFHKARISLEYPFKSNKLTNHKKTKGDKPLRN